MNSEMPIRWALIALSVAIIACAVIAIAIPIAERQEIKTHTARHCPAPYFVAINNICGDKECGTKDWTTGKKLCD